MPTTEAYSRTEERDRDRDPDRGDRPERTDKGERSSKQQKSAPAASKSKDLSHVPCKFFRVGGCTAGSSCPFSHNLQEPGQQKEACAWFVKGNCKFGHKCALAHILPGQPISMDRKNKKAAQQASNSAVGASGGNTVSNAPLSAGQLPPSKDGTKSRSKKDQIGRNSLLTTAPNSRGPSASGRPPMSILKTSVPAPPVQNTDFASFGAHLDESTQLPNAPAHGKGGDDSSIRPASISEEGADPNTASENGQINPEGSPHKSPPPLPVSVPRNTIHGNHSIDFGPIGSPPVSSLRTRSPMPGQAVAFSPGTSPRPVHTHNSNINGIAMASSPSRGLGVVGTPNTSNAPILSSSPFSAPGTQTGFPMSYNEGGLRSGLSGMGIAKSLGTGLSGPLSRWGNGPGNDNANGGEYEFTFEEDEDFQSNRRTDPIIGRGMSKDGNHAVQDDLEDFIPGSLTDLLTPEERSRRMSRSNTGQTSGALSIALNAANDSNAPGIAPVTGEPPAGAGHRYSRSVPAPSLLSNIKSIWSDQPTAAPTPQQGLPVPTAVENGVGSVGGGSPSLSMLSPSNASAAFLGLHNHYLSAKTKQQGLAASRPFGTRTGPFSPPTSSLLSGAARPSPFDLTQNALHNPAHPDHAAATAAAGLQLGSSLITGTAASTRPIPANTSHLTDPVSNNNAVLLSPNARALQAHAPGQSLPQGLAAGYSRIHALPPLPNVSSPGSVSGGFLTGTPPLSSGLGAGQAFQGIDWSATGTSPIPSVHGFSAMGGSAGSPSATSATSALHNAFGTGASTGAGAEGMLSRLTYSAAARGVATNGNNLALTSSPSATAIANSTSMQQATNPSVPPGLSRNHYNLNHMNTRYHLPISPLSNPPMRGGTPPPAVAVGVGHGSQGMRDDDDDLFRMDR